MEEIKWMVAVLQFWGDEASSADGIVYGGRERPVSTLMPAWHDGHLGDDGQALGSASTR